MLASALHAGPVTDAATDGVMDERTAHGLVATTGSGKRARLRRDRLPMTWEVPLHYAKSAS